LFIPDDGWAKRSVPNDFITNPNGNVGHGKNRLCPTYGFINKRTKRGRIYLFFGHHFIQGQNDFREAIAFCERTFKKSFPPGF
jgi:hypothetical protein